MSRWWYFGPICCPDCQSPISSEALVCPYCHSAAPFSAPWHSGRWWPLLVLAVAAALTWLCDLIFGTNLLASAAQFFQKKH